MFAKVYLTANVLPQCGCYVVQTLASPQAPQVSPAFDLLLFSPPSHTCATSSSSHSSVGQIPLRAVAELPGDGVASYQYGQGFLTSQWTFEQASAKSERSRSSESPWGARGQQPGPVRSVGRCNLESTRNAYVTKWVQSYLFFMGSCPIF